ncbi:hypothetical protein BKG96_00895 [Rodentibacter caecimuris]|uniref:Uncharacterized protein n=1 Tax=Rodentibacter caecimuris TaxID=1796644 RepID=A0A1V3KQ79_9PAST|nr:hypothetical protein BKG96_00895 [Rodentibacter heylii]
MYFFIKKKTAIKSMKVIESMNGLSINEVWIIFYCFLGMRQQMHNIENLYKRKGTAIGVAVYCFAKDYGVG